MRKRGRETETAQEARELLQCLSNCQFGSSVDWRLVTLDGRQQTRDPAACALLKVFGSWQRVVRTHTRTQSTRIAVDHLTRCRCLQLESTVRMAAATKSNKRFAQKCHKPNGSAAIYENVRTTVHAPCTCSMSRGPSHSPHVLL